MVLTAGETSASMLARRVVLQSMVAEFLRIQLSLADSVQIGCAEQPEVAFDALRAVWVGHWSSGILRRASIGIGPFGSMSRMSATSTRYHRPPMRCSCHCASMRRRSSRWRPSRSAASRCRRFRDACRAALRPSLVRNSPLSGSTKNRGPHSDTIDSRPPQRRRLSSMPSLRMTFTATKSSRCWWICCCTVLRRSMPAQISEYTLSHGRPTCEAR